MANYKWIPGRKNVAYLYYTPFNTEIHLATLRYKQMAYSSDSWEYRLEYEGEIYDDTDGIRIMADSFEEAKEKSLEFIINQLKRQVGYITKQLAALE